MNSRVYWSLIFYGVFCRIMLSDWDGWMDALSTVAWVGGTVYLTYNMQWSSYRSNVKDVSLVMKKNDKGKEHPVLEFKYEKRDAVSDVGFWLVWLGVLFILELFHLTLWLLLIVIAAALIILMVTGVAYIANNVRPVYNRIVPWFVWMRARARYAIETIGARIRPLYARIRGK